VRIRNTEKVIAEMKFLYEQYGFTGFMFYDDELNDLLEVDGEEESVLYLAAVGNPKNNTL